MEILEDRNLRWNYSNRAQTWIKFQVGKPSTGGSFETMFASQKVPPLDEEVEKMFLRAKLASIELKTVANVWIQQSRGELSTATTLFFSYENGELVEYVRPPWRKGVY